MYLPILTLRTSGIPRCRIASRTAFPCGSSTAAFGITITFAFIISQYFSTSTRTSAIHEMACSSADILFRKDNFDLAVAAKHVDSHIAFVVSGQQKVNAGASYFQITNSHLRKERRQKWL